jgi:hypothetical protein
MKRLTWPRVDARIVVTILLGITLFGCRRFRRDKGPPPPHPAAQVAIKPAPTTTWVHGALKGIGEVRGIAGEVRIALASNGLALEAEANYPATVELGTTRCTNDRSRGACIARLDVTAAVTQLKVASLATVATLDVPVRVQVAGYEDIVQKTPPLSIGGAVAAVLSTAAVGPLVFPGETAPTGPRGLPSTIAIVTAPDSYSRKVKVIGKGLLVGDIDAVIMPSDIPTGRTHTCSGYNKSAGFSPLPSYGPGNEKVTFALYDRVLKLYDRRTGEMMTETTLSAPKRCPSYVSLSSEPKLYVDDDAVEVWARTQLSRDARRQPIAASSPSPPSARPRAAQPVAPKPRPAQAPRPEGYD